jgi:hypothetical protein
MLAGVPLLFAVQQAAEGVVWLTMARNDRDVMRTAATAIFLAIAMVVWPVWVALAFRLVEQSAIRRRMLNALLVLGGVVSATSTVLVLRWQPVPVAAGHSIRYDYPQSGNQMLSLFLVLAYAVPTVGPFFVSTVQTSRTIGATLIVSLALALIVEREALTSVWCFFAAVLSIQILNALATERRSPSAGVAPEGVISVLAITPAIK